MYQEPWHQVVPSKFSIPDYIADTSIWTPRQPLHIVPSRLVDDSAPVYGWGDVQKGENNLLGSPDSPPMGDQIVVVGKVTDSWGRPVRNTLIEIWQANSSGKYVHFNDHYPKPLDPNFTGAGRTITDDQGDYVFHTIIPGAYPWWKDINAWRAKHIHFSLTGRGLTERFITQMLFPGDPLIADDPISVTIPDAKVRERLVSKLDWASAEPEAKMAYRFDIVLGGRDATPMEH
jgi:protocatechuate 3,4-dioxygenase, beta subunit